MNVFAIIRVGDPIKMKGALERISTKDVLSLGGDQWLVAFPGSARELSEKLEIIVGDSGSVSGPAMVVQFEDYYGRASRPIWDWIKKKLEEPDERAS